MKTTTFQDILNQAAEFAQRTRDKLPPQELVMLQGYLASQFETLYGAQAWPELVPPFWNATNIVNRTISKNEGSTDPANPELGDVLAVLTHDPHVHDRFDKIGGRRRADNGDGEGDSYGFELFEPETVSDELG